MTDTSGIPLRVIALVEVRSVRINLTSCAPYYEVVRSVGRPGGPQLLDGFYPFPEEGFPR
jgi:hypothetical protein